MAAQPKNLQPAMLWGRYLPRAGFQLSLPPRTVDIVISRDSPFVSCFAHFTRSFGRAPGPELLYSANGVFFPRSARPHLFQPGGRTAPLTRQLKKLTAAKSRQGRPKYFFTPSPAVISHLRNTKPN